MNLENVILENERIGKVADNHKIVRAKLKELVNNSHDKIADLLSSFGIQASSLVPKAVLYSVLVKHLETNSALRAAISNMLLGNETDYLNANGQTMTIAGGALQAIGNVLSGLGRNQSMNAGNNNNPLNNLTQTQQQQAAAAAQQAAAAAQKKKNTNIAIGVTVGVVVLVTVILLILHSSKKHKAVATSATVQTLN